MRIRKEMLWYLKSVATDLKSKLLLFLRLFVAQTLSLFSHLKTQVLFHIGTFCITYYSNCMKVCWTDYISKETQAGLSS